MKKLILLIMAIAFTFTLTACMPSDPVYLEPNIVEIEKEVVVTVTETEVVTVETVVVIPSGTEFYGLVDDTYLTYFVQGSKVYVLVLEESDPLLGDPVAQLQRVIYINNGQEVKNLEVPDDWSEYETHLGNDTIVEFVEGFLEENDFDTIQDFYKRLEEYYILNATTD